MSLQVFSRAMKFQACAFVFCVVVCCDSGCMQGAVGDANAPFPDTELPPEASQGGTAGTWSSGGGNAGGPAAIDAARDTPPKDTPRDAGDPQQFEVGVPNNLDVGMFVAIGQGGRRIASCDDGASWTGEQSVNQNDGDHAPWSAKGIAYGYGSFVSAFGWGSATAFLLTSDNGVQWQQTFGLTQTGPNAGDVAFGDGVFLVSSGRSMAYVSSDLGATWKVHIYGGDAPILRNLVFSKGNFVAVGDNNRVVYTPDKGKTWVTNTTASMVCAGRMSMAAAGGDVILTAGKAGGCRSRDGGVSWQAVPAPIIPGVLVWTGVDFYGTGVREGYRTSDGEVWSTVKHSLELNTWVRFIAVSDAGTFAGVDERGDKFFRSTDGQRWLRAEGPAGTTIVEIAYGATQASSTCKAP